MNEKYKETIAFIRETFEKPEEFIPLHAPVFNGNEKKYVEECIDTTFVSSVGKFVNRFEQDVADYTGANKAVVCVNGTNALFLALKLVGVKHSEEVITQPFAFIATANAIAYCDAHPVFVDIDTDTLGLSPASLEQFLKEHAEVKGNECFNKKTGRRIAACVPMHTFGHPCKIDEIVTICDKYNIAVVEDAAESIGSYYKQKHTGTFGKIGVLSFNGNKTITTGGGGMLLFSDQALADRAKHLTTQAKVPHPWNFEHDEVGYNYRMPNINAALGCAQMEQLESIISQKRALAARYKEFFSRTGIDFISEPGHSHSNYWLNAILLTDHPERNEFLKFTNDNGIMTRPAWTLLNKLPMYKDAQTYSISNAINIESRLVNIPSSPPFTKHTS